MWQQEFTWFFALLRLRLQHLVSYRVQQHKVMKRSGWH